MNGGTLCVENRVRLSPRRRGIAKLMRTVWRKREPTSYRRYSEVEAQKVARHQSGRGDAIAVARRTPRSKLNDAAAALKAYGRIDILVNNAAFTRP